MGKVGMNLGLGLGVKKGSGQIWTPDMVPGLLAEYNAKKINTVFADNYDTTLEVFDINDGFAASDSHGIKASLLNGTDQYWQIALPSEIITNTSFETNVSSWVTGSTTSFATDTELGKQGNYCAKWVFTTNGTLTPTLTASTVVGARYKVKLYYKSTVDVAFQSGTTTVYTLKATSEWNYASFIFTAGSTIVRLLGATAGTMFIDDVSMKVDQGFDLNKDQEQILHSKNWDFERTLGTDALTNTGWSGTTDWTGTSSIEGLAAGIIGREDYAVEFDGSAEYLQISLPNDLAGFDLSALSHGSTSLPTGWSISSATSTIKTDVVGSAKCLEVNGSGLGGLVKSLLTSGKKYKLKIRYKSNVPVNLGRSGNSSIYGSLSATSEWNTISKVIIADVTGNLIFFASTTAGIFWIESITFVEDQGFDLNKDHEQILHSKNWDFERTLGTELASGTVTIGSKYVVTAGTVEGNAVGTEFLAVTNATTLDANNKVREIPNLVRNGTFAGTVTEWSNGSGTWTFASNKATHTAGVGNIIQMRQSSLFIVGKRYKISYEIVDMTAGSFNVEIGDLTPFGETRTTNGVYTDTLTAGGTFLDMQPSADFDGSIKNVHVYEIPEWTASGNHSGDLSIIDKSSGTQSYKITASGAGRGAEVLTNPDITGSSTGWTINGTTCTYGTNNLVCVNVDNSSAFNNNADLVVGKTYEITYTITRTAGTIKFRAGTGHTGTARTASGTYTEIVTCATTTRLFGDGTGFYGTIESVSVKEYLGEVSLPFANLESCVSGKKYTLQGEARLDASSLSYGANLLTGDGTSGWTAGAGTGSVVGGEYVLSSTASGYIYRTINSPNNILKVTFKAKADTYTGKLFVYHQSNLTPSTAITENLTSTYQTFTVYLVAKSNQQTFYIQLGTTHTGNVYFDDITIQEATPVAVTAQLGTKNVTSSALSIVQGTFTKFVLNFEATASEVNQDLKLWLSGAGSVYVDKLSLTQRYDWLRITKFKETIAQTQFLFSINSGGTSSTTDDYISSGTSLNPRFFDNSGIVESPNSKTITTNIWYNYIALFDNTTVKSYFDGALYATDSTITIGKSIAASPLVIGAYGTGTSKFGGLISHIQIIRFENISQSSFNSAITGLQYPVGGGAEEVLRLTFQDGTSFANTLKDYSPKNHSLSNPGLNMDITNRKRVQ